MQINTTHNFLCRPNTVCLTAGENSSILVVYCMLLHIPEILFSTDLKTIYNVTEYKSIKKIFNTIMTYV